MNRENVSMAVGFVILALGIVILLFTFMQAYALISNVGDYFDEQFPGEGGDNDFEPPSAQFSWSTDDLDVQFSDEAEEGDASITSWDWNFDDGATSNQQNPQHTYGDTGDYRVRLEVEDTNGETSTSYGEVFVEMGRQDGGTSEGDERESGFDLNFSSMAGAFLVAILFLVMYLIGGSLVKGGWNLIKPGPSTVKLKIKPKKLETEMEGAAQPYPYQGAPAYYPQQPQQGGSQPQPTQKATSNEYPPDEEHLENGS